MSRDTPHLRPGSPGDQSKHKDNGQALSVSLDVLLDDLGILGGGSEAVAAFQDLAVQGLSS